jgi:hypothetical protein
MKSAWLLALMFAAFAVPAARADGPVRPPAGLALADGPVRPPAAWVFADGPVRPPR